jgi:hypothetical protein
MHDHIRARGDNRGMNGFLIQRISDNGFGSEFPQEVRFRGRSRQSGHPMPSVDKARNQAASDSARRAGNENAHGSPHKLLLISF